MGYLEQSAATMLRPVPAALPAQSLLPGWLGHCSPWALSLAQFAGWPCSQLCTAGPGRKGGQLAAGAI